MDDAIRQLIWAQFGAAVDTLHAAIVACPDALWRRRMWREGGKEDDYSEVWNVVYHALFWLDLYLTGKVEGFAPPPPIGLDELDPRGLLPERHYTKEELSRYLGYCRDKGRKTLEGLTDARAREDCTFPWGRISFLELQLYSMRHVQEHAAQLSLVIGQEGGTAPGWVGRAR
jgi:hypothetical protein